MNCSLKHWISLQTTILLLFCQSNSNTIFGTVLINQALLLNFFFKYQYIISCCPCSEGYMILAFLPHLFSLLLVICFEISITQTVFNFPWRLELLRVNCIKKLILLEIEVVFYELVLDTCCRLYYWKRTTCQQIYLSSERQRFVYIKQIKCIQGVTYTLAT